MALKIFEKFAPRANPIDGNYTTGSIKNESVPGANDGTPLDAEWGNDEQGFTDALLAEAGIDHSGNPDVVGNSDRLNALKLVHINNLSQAYTFKTVALMKSSLIIFPVGKKITWQGYYVESDGGSNWGIVNSGAHTDDGGEFFTLADGQYIQANIKGKRINVKKYGANGDGVTPTRAQVQNAIIKMEETGQTLYFPLAKYIIEAPLVGTDNKPMYLEGDDIGAANNGSRPHTELIFTSTTPEDALIKCGAQVHLKAKGLYFTTNDNTIILHGIQVGDRNLLKGVGGDDARLHQNIAAGDFLVEDNSFVDFGGTALILGGETLGVINRNGFNRNSTHVDYDAFGEYEMGRNHFSSNIGTQTAPRIVNGGGPYPTPYTYTTDATRDVGVYIGRTVSKVEKNVWASSFDKPLIRFDSCNVVGLVGNTMERPGNTVMASNMIEIHNDGTFEQFGKTFRIEGNHLLAGQATGTIVGRIIKFSGADNVARCMSIRDNGCAYGSGVDDYIPIVDCTDNTARPKEILIENNMTEHTRSPLLGFADGAVGNAGTSWLGGVKGADISFQTVTLDTFTVLANKSNEQAGTPGINFIFYYRGNGAMYVPVQIDVDADSVVGAGTESVQFYTNRDLSKADLVDMAGESHETTICAMREEYMHNTRTDQDNNLRLQYDSGSTADVAIKYSVKVTYAIIRAYNRGATPSISEVYVGTSAPA